MKLYTDVKDLMEMTYKEKHSRVKTVENMNKMFDHGREMRKSISIQIQTDLTSIISHKADAINPLESQL